ncbi:MAG: hypothetical protein ACI9TV_000756 [Sulfurimonas sp.]|jgi:hypothetical protein|uniref:hypothetical protein n=1 Tax=Sulfurimonas sp. TaxID=2022749 RepID=UPI0039E3A0D1
MKKLHILLILLLLSLSSYAKDNNTSDFGKVEGLIRLYHVFEPAYVKSGRVKDYDIDGSTIGGHIRYYTPELSGFGATTALYYTRGTGLNNKYDINTIMAAGRFFTQNYSPKAVLGELNLHYTDSIHKIVLGRFKVDSPITNAIFTYMPNMYEAFLYENSSLKNTKITIAQIERMAYGSRAPVEFGLIGEATRTGGTTQNAINIRGDFIDVEKQTLADPLAKTNGITALGVVDTSLEDITIRVWDFYAHDIINMLYVDATYKAKDRTLPYRLSAQYLRVDSIGKDLALKWMDAKSAYFIGAKATLKYKKAFAYIAYNHSGNAKILNPWSGDPAYTSSFFSKNAYRANVDAYKIGFNYDLVSNLKLITSHASYSKSTTLGTFAPARPVEVLKEPEYDAFESAILLSYNPFRELNILGGFIYKTSEYSYAGEQVKLLDADLLITYRF